MHKQGALSIRGVSKSFGSHNAVKEAALEVAPGEFVTLLGPSGSGKSTTLGMVAGFTRPDSGEILIDNVRMDDIPSHRRNLGMVFQNYALFPHMTVEQNIQFPLVQRKLPRNEMKHLTDEVLNLVDLNEHRAKKPSQLSGGQQQRVAFARAIVYSPPLLLMDEPMGALDRRLREALQTELRRLHRDLGSTFLYVTHDQEEALSMSDRVAVFNAGQIVQVGTPLEIYQNPGTEFVARFVGESNIIEVIAPSQNLSMGQLNTTLGPLKVGSPNKSSRATSVMIRPESFIARTDEGATASRNEFEVLARVEDETFLGNTRRLTARHASGTQLLIDETTGCWSHVGVGDEATWTVKDELIVALNSEPVMSDTL